MQLPYFFEENITSEKSFFLGEDTSRHVVQVLRMHEGELIQLTNGKGDLFTASITIANKKKTEVSIAGRIAIPARPKKIAVAISPIKNTSRFEWFLEKVTELGVSEIIPLLCNRTEKHYLKIERIQNIIVSAMLQSKQCWLPDFKKPMDFPDFIKQSSYDAKFVAHCMGADKKTLNRLEENFRSAVVSIGPEGDFTEAEVKNAVENGFQPVDLGQTRLRTETAGIVAAVLLINN